MKLTSLFFWRGDSQKKCLVKRREIQKAGQCNVGLNTPETEWRGSCYADEMVLGDSG